MTPEEIRDNEEEIIMSKLRTRAYEVTTALEANNPVKAFIKIQALIEIIVQREKELYCRVIGSERTENLSGSLTTKE